MLIEATIRHRQQDWAGAKELFEKILASPGLPEAGEVALYAKGMLVDALVEMRQVDEAERLNQSLPARFQRLGRAKIKLAQRPTSDG